MPTYKSPEPKAAKMDLSVQRFCEAMVNPFAPTAKGAKVPDVYAFPTNTYAIQTSVLLGGAVGTTSFGLIALANPFCTLIDTGALSTLLPTTVSSPGGMFNVGGGGVGAQAFWGLTTPGKMGGVASAFRFVSGGVRLRNLQPEMTATGRIYIACVPLANGGLPTYTLLNNRNPTAAGYSAIIGNMGLSSPAILASAAIQEYPLSKDYTVGSLVGTGEIEVDFQVFHPNAFNFKSPSNSNAYNATLSEGDDAVFVAATGQVDPVTSDKESNQCDGTAAIIIWCEGFPASAGNAPLEMDLIMHFETTPLQGPQTTASSAGIVPVPTAMPTVCHGSTAAVEAAIAVANTPERIIREISQAGSAAVQFAKVTGLDSVAKGLLGGGLSKAAQSVASAVGKFLFR